jgi:hypothetical protein
MAFLCKLWWNSIECEKTCSENSECDGILLGMRFFKVSIESLYISEHH